MGAGLIIAKRLFRGDLDESSSLHMRQSLAAAVATSLLQRGTEGDRPQLPWQLRPAMRPKEALRPGQPVPAEREHPPGLIERGDHSSRSSSLFGQLSFSSRDNERSASNLSPVWQRAQ